MPGLNIATILSYVLAVAVGVLIYFVYAKLNISKANVSAQKIIDDATSKADNLVKEAILDAKTQAYELKLEAEKEIKEQKIWKNYFIFNICLTSLGNYGMNILMQNCR